MSAPALPGIFGTVEPILINYGYLAVAALVMIEDFGIPVPGETVLIAASLFAGAGRLNVVLVGVIGTVAAIIGDNIGFAIGHFGGRTLALRFGKYVFLTEERLDKAESFFERHGGKIIVVARFIEGLRQANGIVAGTSGMHWKRFVVFNALGAALWAGVWVSLGYLAGNNITAIYTQITRYSLYVLIALIVLVAGFIVWRLWRRQRRRRKRAAQAAAGTGQAAEIPGASEIPAASKIHDASAPSPSAAGPDDVLSEARNGTAESSAVSAGRAGPGTPRQDGERSRDPANPGPMAGNEPVTPPAD